jgi:hypothetical protein
MCNANINHNSNKNIVRITYYALRGGKCRNYDSWPTSAAFR